MRKCVFCEVRLTVGETLRSVLRRRRLTLMTYRGLPAPRERGGRFACRFCALEAGDQHIRQCQGLSGPGVQVRRNSSG